MADRPNRSVGSVRVVIGVQASTSAADLERTVSSVLVAGPYDVILLAERSAKTAIAAAVPLVSAAVRLQRVPAWNFHTLLERGVLADGLPTAPEFLAVLTPGDELQPEALSRCEEATRGHKVDLITSDYLLNSPKGQSVVALPAWSPDRLRSSYYLGPFAVARRELLADILQVADSEVAGPHDLALRLAETALLVAHIPEPLAIAGMLDSGYDLDSGYGMAVGLSDAKAVSAHIERLGLPIQVAKPQGSQTEGLTSDYTLQPKLSRKPKVSVIILTGGATREIGGRTVLLVANAVASLMVNTSYVDYEIVVVLDRNAPGELGDSIKALAPDRVIVTRDERPFNFSASNNLGVEKASGEILVFLNDDVEVMTGDWLDRIAMHLATPGIAIVGARLLFGDGRVQHAGLIARNGWLEHRFGGYRNGPETTLAPLENLSAVTAACLAIERDVFRVAGGFNEEFPLNFNDVDLCFAVQDMGQRIVLDHEIVLTHHESSSREPGISDAEQALFTERWPSRSKTDPYDNPNYIGPRAQPIVAPAALLGMRKALGLACPPVRFMSGSGARL